MISMERQKHLLNLAATRYNYFHGRSNESESLEETILKKLELKNAKVLMDMGCGSGKLMIKVLDRFSNIRVIGIDVNRTRFETLTKSLKILKYDHRGSIRPVTYFSTGTPEGSVDRFVFIDSLRYCVDVNIKEVVKELDKISADESICVVSDFFSFKDEPVIEWDGTYYHSIKNFIKRFIDSSFELDNKTVLDNMGGNEVCYCSIVFKKSKDNVLSEPTTQG